MRKLPDIAKKEAGKGLILKHINMANRCSIWTGVKNVFLNSAAKTTSKHILSDQCFSLDYGAMMKIYNQEFLSVTESELYVA